MLDVFETAAWTIPLCHPGLRTDVDLQLILVARHSVVADQWHQWVGCFLLESSRWALIQRAPFQAFTPTLWLAWIFGGRVLMTSSVNLPLILPTAGLVSHSHTAQRSDPEVGPAAHLPFAKKEHPLRSPDLGCWSPILDGRPAIAMLRRVGGPQHGDAWGGGSASVDWGGSVQEHRAAARVARLQDASLQSAQAWEELTGPAAREVASKRGWPTRRWLGARCSKEMCRYHMLAHISSYPHFFSKTCAKMGSWSNWLVFPLVYLH